MRYALLIFVVVALSGCAESPRYEIRGLVMDNRAPMVNGQTAIFLKSDNKTGATWVLSRDSKTWHPIETTLDSDVPSVD